MRDVGEVAEAGGKALELRQVERPAGNAGDIAVGVYPRHGDGDDWHVREASEDHIGHGHLPAPHRLDEVLAVGNRRRGRRGARREDLADDAARDRRQRG